MVNIQELFIQMKYLKLAIHKLKTGMSIELGEFRFF